jgi:uncharacterized protein HemX
MTDPLAILALCVLCLALGAAGMAWLKSRKTTTKAEAMRLLAIEAALVAKMPGAAEAHALADAQAQDEALSASKLSAALSKAAGVPAGA